MILRIKKLFTRLWPRKIPVLEVQRVASFQEYRDFSATMAEAYQRRSELERSLISGSNFTVEGYCYPCRSWVNLSVDFLYAEEIGGERVPNWRERLVCPDCGLNNRMRAVIQLAEEGFRLQKSSNIYLTEATTSLYRWFANRYPRVVGSEYLGDSVPLGGMNQDGLRNEDVTRLSFVDGELDLIASFDVFEHVPDFKQAFRECQRVLKTGGRLFFTVPFRRNSEANIVRARLHPNGRIEHLLPPQYHGNPIDPEGCLAFYVFGWEMLDQLRDIGFADVEANLYWSSELGYLGEEQIAFVAVKG